MFVDLEKVFDRVPREDTRFPFRRKSVPEYLVNRVMSLYQGCKMLLQLKGNYHILFYVKVIQWSPLIPLLAIVIFHYNGCFARRCEE